MTFQNLFYLLFQFRILNVCMLIAFHTPEMTELMVFIMLEMKLEIAFQTDVTTLEIVLNVVEIAV